MNDPKDKEDAQMADASMTAPGSGMHVTAGKVGKIWTDIFPIIIFITLYNVLRRVPETWPYINPETSLYWATGALIVCTLFIILLKRMRKEAIPPFLIVTSLLVGGFGTLGILLQDKMFIYYKPTIQNWFIASLIFGGFALGHNIWKYMFKTAFNLPDFAWRTLAIRWGLFFIEMGFLNEFLWRRFSEDIWANWLMGNIVIVIVFGALNTPYMLKHLDKT